MNRRRFTLAIAFTVLVAVVLLWGSPLLSRRSTAAPVPTTKANFKGKILLISASHGQTGYTVVLEDVRVQKLGERSFLVGKGVECSELNWYKGATVWVPLNLVLYMSEYDNKEAVQKMIQERAKALPAAPVPQAPTRIPQ